MEKEIEAEIKRVKELREMYVEIGPAGFFGVSTINLGIENAERAIKSGDETEMTEALENLKGLEG